MVAADVALDLTAGWAGGVQLTIPTLRGIVTRPRTRTVRLAGSAERSSPTSPDASHDVATIGVLVLDDRGRITARSASARAQLADLTATGATDTGNAPGDAPSDALPSAIIDLLGQVMTLSDSDGPPAGVSRVRGRSERWYTLRAIRAEPSATGESATGESATIILIEPLTACDEALLCRLYHLTPREREVIVHVLRGESTKRIAAALELSAHTVQDHIDHACDKLGVRGRRALLAKLFTDGYATALLARDQA